MMKKEETFAIAGIARFASNLEKLAEHNPDYDLTKTELTEKGLVGQRIYEQNYPCEDVTLQLCTWPEENETEEVPGVFVSGEQVGYIRKASCDHVRKLLDSGQIKELSLAMHGGPYRILLESDSEEPQLEDGDAGMFALLTLGYEEKDPEAASENGNGDSPSYQYISTSYDTITLDNTKKRGRSLLGIALLLCGFYAGFFIPYWLLIRRGMLSPLPVLGGDIANELLNPHMALMLGGLVMAAIGMLVRISLFPMLAALLLIGSCYTVPGYTLFMILPALFCCFAALRRHSKGFMTFLKILAFLAVCGVSGYFLKDTAIRTYETRQLAILPTGTEDPVPVLTLPGADLSSAEDQDDAEWEMDEDDWDTDDEDWDADD